MVHWTPVRTRWVIPLVLLLAVPTASAAQTTCNFTRTAAVWLLNSDCFTPASIEIPDGVTLDGNHHTIYAIDPADRGFQGGIIVARGRWASVVDTSVSAILLANVCQAGVDRLRGIYFEGASGAIRRNTVDNVNKGESTCEEGNGIEVRNIRPDGPAPNVEIDHNLVDRYQKTGIIVHGNIDAVIRYNVIRGSVTQDLMAANAVQVGPKALAVIEFNIISGNTFPAAEAAGTAMLLIDSVAGTRVGSNAIVGNADVGIYVLANGALVQDNELTDVGPDGYYDVGIVNLGEGNLFIGNTVRGYRTRYHGIEDAGAGVGGQRIE